MMLKYTPYFFLVFLFSSCSSYFNQPVGYEKAIYGENTRSTFSLKTLPPAKTPVVVGVYKFKDQTGQYKAIDQGSTFSTAVTQGATSILIKALEDSKWFVPIERENIGNLLNERNIIRSTRQEYGAGAKSDSAKASNSSQLAPLLFAGVLLEGGIVSYDSNIMTGGFGARYFGTGGSTRYRQDKISIYLRLVSTSNGKILNTVYVTKTILSQSVDVNLFKYVNVKRLLEIETGFTRNEPVQMAVTEAIEKAVEGLVMEGIKDKLWEVDATPPEVKFILEAYEQDKEKDNLGKLPIPNANRTANPKRGDYAMELGTGFTLMDGDYPSARPMPMVRGALKGFVSPNFCFSGSANAFFLANKDVFRRGLASLDLNLEYLVSPYKDLSPFLFLGTAVSFDIRLQNPALKMQYGGGFEYLFSNSFGVKVYAEQNLNFSDNIDFINAGKRDDFYWRFGVGLTYYFPRSTKKNIR